MLRIIRAASTRARLTALAAQLFTVSSMFAPIAFGLTGELPTVVLAAAIATIAVYPATLAAIVRIPTLGSGADARKARRISTMTLIVFSMVGLLVWAGLAFTHWTVATAVTAQVVFMLIGQGLFMIEQAVLIRELNYGRVANLRLAYGVLSAALTIAACALVPTPLFLSLATAVSMTVPAVFLVVRRWSKGIIAPDLGEEGAGVKIATYLRNSIPLGLGLGFGNIATQAPALILPALGPLAPTWSTLTRVGNGFLTVGVTLAGPPISIRFSSALQAENGAELRRALRPTITLCAALAAVASATLLVVQGWQSTASTIPAAGELALLVAVLGFWTTQTFVAPIGLVLPMMPGGSVRRIVYDVLRVGALVAPVLILQGTTLLVSFGAAALICNAVFLTMFVHVVNRYAVVPSKGRSRLGRIGGTAAAGSTR